MNNSLLVAALVVFLALGAGTAAYTVDQTENALVFQLGEIVTVQKTPGLKLKIPGVQNVRFFDMRLRSLDSPEPERFITSEKKNVLVDSFVMWKISDVKQYYVSVGGDDRRAENRLAQTINDGLRAEFGKRTVHDVVSGERDEIMEVLRAKANQDASKIGVEVVDVRLKRVELPQEVSEAVYRRMEAERKRVANELRSEGSAEGERIRADADRQREVILAEAYRQAQTVKGEGDGKAAKIYADAYEKSPDFYSFYRSMQLYRESFRDKQDVMVLDPNADFMKYFKNPRPQGGQ